MASWIIGDIHGCADELALLLDKLALGPGDLAISVGDLFHRGPDAWGVVCLMREHRVRFVLGNHERAVLRRVGLAPDQADGSDRPALRTNFPPIHPEDLKGDGNRLLKAAPEHLSDILVFLQGHDGYALSSQSLAGSGPTADGRDWLVVHAGVPPKCDALQATPEGLVYPARIRGKRSPYWYERWDGPELVHFGHLPFKEPLVRKLDGQVVAVGLDTGCVYGGVLSAYCPEKNVFVSVPAAKAYAQM